MNAQTTTRSVEKEVCASISTGHLSAYARLVTSTAKRASAKVRHTFEFYRETTPFRGIIVGWVCGSKCGRQGSIPFQSYRRNVSGLSAGHDFNGSVVLPLILPLSLSRHDLWHKKMEKGSTTHPWHSGGSTKRLCKKLNQIWCSWK